MTNQTNKGFIPDGKERYEFKFKKEIEKNFEIEEEEAKDDVETMTEEVKKEKGDNSGQKLENENVSKKEEGDIEGREFLQMLVEEEPVEGILTPEDSENDKPKQQIVIQQERKPKVEKPKEKKEVKKPIEVKKNTGVKKTKEQEEQEEQAKFARDLELFLVEINEGQESGVLELSSSGQNSRSQSSISPKNKKYNKIGKDQLEKETKETIQKNSKTNSLKKDNNKNNNNNNIKKEQKNEEPTKEQLELQEKQDIRELFRQFEEMQEEGVLKPNQKHIEERSNTKKEPVEVIKKERIRSPRKEQKKSSQPALPVNMEIYQSNQEFNEKAEIRELFRQFEEQQEEGILHDSSDSHFSKRTTQNSNKDDKNTKKKQVNPKEEKPKEVKKTQEIKKTIVNNVPDEPTISPEELQRRELREFFRQLEEEQEESLLKFSSDAIASREHSIQSKRSVKSTKSSQKSENEVRVKKTIKNSPTKTQEIPIIDAAEQEKRDLIQLYKELEEDEEEGLLHLPDDKNLSQFSRLSQRSTASRQKTASRQSTLSKQSNVSKSKENRAKH